MYQTLIYLNPLKPSGYYIGMILLTIEGIWIANYIYPTLKSRNYN
jgi:hypothetical protein